MTKETVKPTFSDIVDLVREHYKESFDVDMGYAKSAEIVDEAILPQKQSHADMVIGKDEHGSICGYFVNGVCNCQYDWVNRAKAEQRLRNQTGDKS